MRGPSHRIEARGSCWQWLGFGRCLDQWCIWACVQPIERLATSLLPVAAGVGVIPTSHRIATFNLLHDAAAMWAQSASLGFVLLVASEGLVPSLGRYQRISLCSAGGICL